MNNTTRYPSGVAGALLICILVVGPASAYNADTACASLMDVIAGGGSEITTLELVIIYLDGGLDTTKLWTESIIDPEVSLAAKLRNTTEDEEQARDISRIILTLVSEEERISYKLSPGTSVFVELEEPLDFPQFPDNVPEETERMLFIMKNLRNITESDTRTSEFLDAFLLKSRIAERLGSASVQPVYTNSLLEQALESRTGTTISTKNAELSRIGISNGPDSATVTVDSTDSDEPGGRISRLISKKTSITRSGAIVQARGGG